MASLTGSTIANTYTQLLRMGNATLHATTGYYIKDSADTNSALSISTTRVGINTAVPSNDLSVHNASGGIIAINREDADNAITDTNALGQIVFGGDDPTNNTFQQGAAITALAAGAWDNNDCGADLVFKTCTDGSNSLDPRMVILDSGNVGIGIAAPSHPLDVRGTPVQMGSSGHYTVLQVIDDNTEFDATPKSGISFGGNYTSGATAFFGGIHVEKANTTENEQQGEMSFWTRQSATGNAVEVMRLDDSGNVGIGIAAPTYTLDVVGSPSSSYVARFHSDGAATTDYGILIQAGADSPGTDGDCRWIGFADGDGTVEAVLQYKHSGTTGEIVGVSDERLKENIKDTSIDGLSAINSLNFREFNWTTNSNRGSTKIPIGLVAQEVTMAGDKCGIVTDFADERELKDGSKITDVQGVGYDGILLYLAKAVQELSAKVEALENA